MQTPGAAAHRTPPEAVLQPAGLRQSARCTIQSPQAPHEKIPSSSSSVFLCREAQQVYHSAEAFSKLLFVTLRPFNGCSGRAFSGYRFANAAICVGDTSTGVLITSQVTPSVHGGIVSEPENL